jgi:elongation factor P
LRLRFVSIDASGTPSGVDLQFQTSVLEYRYGNACHPDQAWNGPRIRGRSVPRSRVPPPYAGQPARTGNNFEHRFRAADTIEKASMETHDLEFMYQGGNTYHFMNTENYDQLEIEEEVLGDNAQWMQPGMKILAEYYDGRAIGIQLPQTLNLAITDTAPVMKTATKTASTKPATLENGVTINVPEFIATGERVRVNPTTGEYMDRAKD